MIDLYLRAATEAELKDAIAFAVNSEGNWLVATHQWAIDPIGALVREPALFDDDGTLLTPAVLDQRFHANLRLLDHALVEQVPVELRVMVDSPSRVWA